MITKAMRRDSVRLRKNHSFSTIIAIDFDGTPVEHRYPIIGRIRPFAFVRRQTNWTFSQGVFLLNLKLKFLFFLCSLLLFLFSHSSIFFILRFLI